MSQRIDEDPHVIKNICLSIESTLFLNGIINRHNRMYSLNFQERSIYGQLFMETKYRAKFNWSSLFEHFGKCDMYENGAYVTQLIKFAIPRQNSHSLCFSKREWLNKQFPGT